MNAPQKPRSPLKPLDDALADLLAHAQPLPGLETVDTFNADGRVLAQDCVSALHVPPQDNSSMDGYAVRLADVVDWWLENADRFEYDWEMHGESLR